MKRMRMFFAIALSLLLSALGGCGGGGGGGTLTPTPTSGPTGGPTPIVTPVVTPTGNPTPSATPSVTPSITPTVSPTGEPTPTPTATSTGYYGSGINADDIANIVVGWNVSNDICNRVISYRFRANHTGLLKSIRPFFIWSKTKPGYHKGNGGHIKIEIQTDDGSSNHFPSGIVLASLVFDHPVPVPIPDSGNNNFPLLTFPAPATITAGQLIHFVFTNVDEDPKENWVSLDCLFMWHRLNPVQPTFTDIDMAVLERKKCTGDWIVYNRGSGSYTPCIELDFDDGFSQGQGYIQGYNQVATTSWENPKPISGLKSVREIFTVSGSDRVVSSVSVRVNRTSGSSPLTVLVEKNDGSIVGQGAAMVPQGTRASSDDASWVRIPFATPLTLKSGTGYRLVLQSPADTIHKTHGLQEGKAYGYKPSTYFSDGNAEFNNGTGWVGWDLWGIKNRKDIDLQFFFETIDSRGGGVSL